MMSDQQPPEEPFVMEEITPPQNDEWRDIILHPVTIFQVLQSESLGNPLIAEGKNFAAVALVAHVTRVDIFPTKASFILEDGTGKIGADRDLHSLTVRLGQSAEAEEEEIAECKAFEHAYVEVIAKLVKNNSPRKPRIKIYSICVVHDYHQVMYHILLVMHRHVWCSQLECLQDQPHGSDQDFGPSEDMENMPTDDVQDDISIQHHIIYALPASPAILPNTFSPQRHQPYATLRPLERAIMRHMHCQGDSHVLIAEMALAIQGSSGCTESQFNLALQALLSEAYITSPLDDGHVVTTPRHSGI